MAKDKKKDAKRAIMKKLVKGKKGGKKPSDLKNLLKKGSPTPFGKSPIMPSAGAITGGMGANLGTNRVF